MTVSQPPRNLEEKTELRKLGNRARTGTPNSLVLFVCPLSLILRNPVSPRLPGLGEKLCSLHLAHSRC